MVYSFYDKVNSSSGHDGLLSSSHNSLVFEREKVELVKKSPATARVGSKNSEISEAKALAALKSHSEAEKRRRERINGHLSTLRGLVPSNEKVCFFVPSILFFENCSFADGLVISI